MWNKRFALLVLAFLMPWLTLTSCAQEVFASGGALFSEAPASSNFDGTRPVGQVGARLPYTSLFTLQGALSYQGPVALEGALQFHPFGRVEGVKPYAFGGFGYYVAGDDQDERSVVPLGVGVEVPLRPRVALNVEVGGRWTLAQNDPPTSLDLYSGAAPTIGLTYSFSDESPAEEDEAAPVPPLAENTSESEQEPAADEAGEAPAARAPEERRAGDAVADEAPTPPERRASDAVAGEAPMPDERRPGDVIAEEAPMPPSQRRSGGVARRAPSANDTTDGSPVAEQMTEIPAGTFLMGLTDEDPLNLQQAGRKRISVTPFRLDEYEVSNAKYRAFLSELPPEQRQEMTPDSTIWEEARSRSNWATYFRGAEYANYPVIGVTHNQAQRFCEFNGRRLPTEAEWEYAARGSLVGSVYPWQGYEPRNNQGRYLANYNPDRGGYAADGYAFTAPVSAYPSSSWGLHHMSGNVAEWVQDNYHPSYAELSDFNPLYEDPEEERFVVRGGSWASNAFYIGVGVRESQVGDEASPYIGFRCAADVGSTGTGGGAGGGSGADSSGADSSGTGNGGN